MKKNSGFLLASVLFFGMNTAFGDVSQKQDLPHFEAVNLTGVGNLYIKQSNEESFSFEAEESVLPLIKVKVTDKTLYIDLENASAHLKAKISYYLNIKTLNNINVSGLTNVFIKDSLQSDQLNVLISGLGNEADININVKTLNAQIGGGAKIVANGIANTQNIRITGAGEFDGQSLAGDTATVNMNGSSVAKANVSNALTVMASGDSKMGYCAKPALQQNLSDNAKIMHLPGC